MIGSLAVLSCEAAFVATAAPDNSQLLAGASDDTQGVAVMFALMGVCSLVFAITRATAVRRTFVTSRRKEPADLELLQLVARRQQWRALAFAAGCLLAGVMIARLPLALGPLLFLEVTPALMLMVALVSAWRLRPLIKLGADPDVRVESHAHFLYAARGKRLVGWVAAPPKVVAHASSLPVARLRMSV